jgi:hypothetical protein
MNAPGAAMPSGGVRVSDYFTPFVADGRLAVIVRDGPHGLMNASTTGARRARCISCAIVAKALRNRLETLGDLLGRCVDPIIRLGHRFPPRVSSR